MSYDIEKGPMSGASTVVSSPNPNALAPNSPDPNTKRYSQLETFQILIGNVDAPFSPTDADDFYHELLVQERRTSQLYWLTLVLFFVMIALQIGLCLGITIGAQVDFTRDTISEMAALNTAVAAAIGVLKGLGLPEKKAMERLKLRRLIDRIRTTTKKLKVGLNVDAPTEAEILRKIYDETEDAAQLNLKDVEAGVSGGVTAAKTSSTST